MAKKKKEKDVYGNFVMKGEKGYLAGSDFWSNPIFDDDIKNAQIENSKTIATWIADNYGLKVEDANIS